MKFNRSKFAMFMFLLACYLILLMGVSAFAPRQDTGLTVTPTPVSTEVVSPPTTSPDTGPAFEVSGDVLDKIVSLALQFAALVGVAGVIAALVNIGKLTPLVNDGNTGQWYAFLSLLAFGALVALHVFQGIDIPTLDANAGKVATILIFIAGLLVQLKSGQSWHDVLKKLGVPGISTSFSNQPGAAGKARFEQ